MGRIISLHSYRGGTGKSNITANLAYLAARRGKRVAVMDTDVQSPGVHLLLGLRQEKTVHTLSDFLFGKCELEDAAYNLSKLLGPAEGKGALYLIPASMTVEAITRVLAEGYNVSKLNNRFGALMNTLSLDILFLDTHPGLNRETMLTTAVSDILIILLRPDQQDYHGTAVLCEVAGRLGVPKVYMVANKVLESLGRSEVREKIESAYGRELLGILPMAHEMLSLGSGGLFAVQEPHHPISRELDAILDRILDDLPSVPVSPGA